MISCNAAVTNPSLTPRKQRDEIVQNNYGHALVKSFCLRLIGGNLVGSTNEVMSLHLGGALIPLLRPYQTLA
ncbi:hypothetical protein Hanom_Chr03g00240831 [Helianthus anomalus]